MIVIDDMNVLFALHSKGVVRLGEYRTVARFQDERLLALKPGDQFALRYGDTDGGFWRVAALFSLEDGTPDEDGEQFDSGGILAQFV